MDLSEFQFVPLAYAGLYWPSQKTLFVADLHLGKEASFCREGIAVPRGTSERTLRRISEMLAETGAENLVILGDLFHARSSLAEDVRALFASFLESVSPVSVTLVLGNHDRAVGALPKEWPMKIVSAWSMKGISLSHFPSLPIGEDSLALAGHLHPAIKLRGPAGNEGKLACFHYDSTLRCLTLPAVGEFTGTALVHPVAGDRVWISVGSEVREIDLRVVQTQKTSSSAVAVDSRRSIRRS
jgi:uncharacterized protein